MVRGPDAKYDGPAPIACIGRMHRDWYDHNCLRGMWFMGTEGRHRLGCRPFSGRCDGIHGVDRLEHGSHHGVSGGPFQSRQTVLLAMSQASSE